MGTSRALKLPQPGNYGIVMPKFEDKVKMNAAHALIDSYRNTGHVRMLVQAIDLLMEIAKDAQERG